MIAHPFIPDWEGGASWTAPGETPSDYVVFEAGDTGQPFSISHDRDMMFKGGALEQDYNFVDYLFGDPGNPTHARYYLADDHVSVDLPNLPANATIEQAREAFPVGVLQYLQRRFNTVHVLTRDGYRELWAISA